MVTCFHHKATSRFQLSFSATDGTDCFTDHFLCSNRLLSVSYSYLCVRQRPQCPCITCSVWSIAQHVCIDNSSWGHFRTTFSPLPPLVFVTVNSSQRRTFQCHLPLTSPWDNTSSTNDDPLCLTSVNSCYAWSPHGTTSMLWVLYSEPCANKFLFCTPTKLIHVHVGSQNVLCSHETCQ